MVATFQTDANIGSCSGSLYSPFGIASIKRLRAILAADRQRHIRTALVGAKDG